MFEKLLLKIMFEKKEIEDNIWKIPLKIMVEKSLLKIMVEKIIENNGSEPIEINS